MTQRRHGPADSQRTSVCDVGRCSDAEQGRCKDQAVGPHRRSSHRHQGPADPLSVTVGSLLDSLPYSSQPQAPQLLSGAL